MRVTWPSFFTATFEIAPALCAATCAAGQSAASASTTHTGNTLPARAPHISSPSFRSAQPQLDGFGRRAVETVDVGLFDHDRVVADRDDPALVLAEHRAGADDVTLAGGVDDQRARHLDAPHDRAQLELREIEALQRRGHSLFFDHCRAH